MSEKELVLVEQFIRLHWLIPRYVHQCHKTSDPFVNSYSSQGRVLRLMQRKQKATQKELAEILGMRSQSLGELLGKLEKKGYITRFGGTVTNVDEWGKRKLAYEIQKMTEGYYYFVHFEAEPTVPGEVEQRIRIMDNVLRYLCVKQEA